MNHKINLLYIITKLELGGAQRQLLSLIAGLDKEKYRVFLFSAKEGLLAKEAELIPGLTLKKSRFLERPVNFIKDILVFIEICAFIKKNKIELVHTHSSKAGILGRFAARACKVTAIIHTVHGWSFNDYQPRILRNFYLFFEKLCAKFTGKIIVVSYSDREKGLNSSIGSQGQYVLIRYGINASEFAASDLRNQARQALGINKDELAVGMVACFKPQKSPLDFVKIALAVKKEICGIKFIMVGDGQLRNKVSLLIKELGLQDKIILTGWRPDIAFILSALDIFILTSLWEGLPIAVLEAMAAGKPIIATDTGGISEVIENGKNGYLVKPQDNQAMQNRITELLRSRQKREEFISLGRARIDSEEFLLTKMVRATGELYLNLWEEARNA
ncbi:MAG: glycosyltransferase family 4 protein [Candidatus Omnitrophica bacterium]|nr:glycosyltransferase family 4 protein [Candidatus Omnitrophota bacterium]